jgi:hypothetical protein
MPDCAETRVLQSAEAGERCSLHLGAVVALVVHLRTSHRVCAQSGILGSVASLHEESRVLRCIRGSGQRCNTQQCLSGRLQTARREMGVCRQPAHCRLQGIRCRCAHIKSDVATCLCSNASNNLPSHHSLTPDHVVGPTRPIQPPPTFGSSPNTCNFPAYGGLSPCS